MSKLERELKATILFDVDTPTDITPSYDMRVMCAINRSSEDQFISSLITILFRNMFIMPEFYTKQTQQKCVRNVFLV